jgi:hypothetical protein
VLVQSTGGEWLFPDRKGLLTFGSQEDAIAGLNSINGDYLAHCHAARQIAEKHFDSSKVLNQVLCHAGL